MDPQPAKNRLLLVDGDPKSLRVLDVSLKKAGFEVTTATSGRAALASLEAGLPDLIISDTDLDGIDGFELCNRIKAKPEWAKIPFLFVSGRKSIEDKIRGLELGVDDYLTKPIYIKEIGIRVRTALQRAERERMESRREGRTRFAGDLGDVGVVDLVQTIELNRKSGIVHIVNRDDRRGSIFFRDGKVIDAEVGRLSGAHALYRLFSWSEGQFAVEFKHIRRHDVIDLSTAALLMEGMRRLDEATRLLEKLCPATAVLEVDCRVLAEELAELPDEMNSVLRLCDGARTLQEVVEDSDHPDLETLTIISKLFSDQIIFAREPATRGGDAEPGVRLATWLSTGGADQAAPSREIPPSAEIPLAAAAPVAAPLIHHERLPAAAAGLSAEETLGAALPAYADSGAQFVEVAPSKPTPTLKGVPTDDFFAGPVSTGEGTPALVVPSEGKPKRSTQPMGLAERLLSDDSVIRAHAVHEAIADDGGAVRESAPTDRQTQSYGGPVATAAVLVQQVVSSARGQAQAPLPPDPMPPHKEVDWGAWPAVMSSPPSPSMPTPSVSVPATASPSTAEPARDAPSAVDSSAELEPGDLQPLEAGDEAAPPPVPAPAAESVVDGPAEAVSADHGLAPDSALHDSTIDRSLTSSASVETTVVVSQRRPTSMRQLGLLVLGAFALGMVIVLILERRASGPDEATEASGASLPAAASAPQRAPAVTPEIVPLPASATKVAVAVADPNAPAPPGANPAPLAATPPAAPAPTPEKAKEPSAGDEAALAADLRTKCLAANADGKGKARTVVAACRPVLAADPDDAAVMVVLARAEIDRGHLGEARALARKALAVDPERVDAYVYLGTAEQEAGKREEARAAYKKYLELAPDGRFAREIRAILNNL